MGFLSVSVCSAKQKNRTEKKTSIQLCLHGLYRGRGRGSIFFFVWIICCLWLQTTLKSYSWSFFLLTDYWSLLCLKKNHWYNINMKQRHEYKLEQIFQTWFWYLKTLCFKVKSADRWHYHWHDKKHLINIEFKNISFWM